jgi:MFS family permease
MTNEPYNFSTTATGLMFLSALVGSIFGYFTGVFADTIVVFLARRNGGVKEPEMRLWTLCISFVYAGVGYLLYGWAADAGLPWIAIAIGLGAMIAHQVSACSIATAYAMDCFPGVSSIIPKSHLIVSLINRIDLRRNRRHPRHLLFVHQLRHHAVSAVFHRCY